MFGRWPMWTSPRLSKSVAPADPPVLRHRFADRLPRSMLMATERHVLVDAVGRDLQVIEDACRRRNQDALLSCIHALKGALFVVGERAAADDCGAAEERIHAQGIDQSARDIELLKQALRRLQDRYAG